MQNYAKQKHLEAIKDEFKQDEEHDFNMTHWQLVKQNEDNVKQDTPIHSPSKSNSSLQSDEKIPPVPLTNVSH